MNCKYCKVEVPEGYRYCPNCGLLLDLGKQFTAPERKYTIPKYEYQPKKAEAETAAPETTQQFLQPQHEESTEEAEARLELELKKALERDARAQEAAKKPTEAVEFSDEDYAQVEQDDTPDDIELEEKQPAEVLVKSVTLESADGTETLQETVEAEAVTEEAVEAEAIVEAATSEAAEEPAEVEESADAGKEPELIEAESVTEKSAAETESPEEDAEAVTAEIVESEDTADEAAVEESNAETAQPDAAAEEGDASVAPDAGAVAIEISAKPETSAETEESKESETVEASEEIEEPKDSEIEEAAIAEEVPETEKAPVSEAAEPDAAAETGATETAEEAVDETPEEATENAAAERHSDLEERIAALLPDDGLDSTKVDEQGNPAFVWDENISFMEAVSEKSVGDFAVEEDEKAAQTAAVQLAEGADAAATAETQVGTEAAGADEALAAEQKETEPEAAESNAVDETVSETETETARDASTEAEMVPESDAASVETAAVPETIETTEADTESTAQEDVSEIAEAVPANGAEGQASDETNAEESETESAEAPEAVSEPVETVSAEASEDQTLKEVDAESAEMTDEIRSPYPTDASEAEDLQEEKQGRKNRFLIPLAVCAVAAGAVVVYLNLPAQRMSRALTKGRSYVESNNFTAAVPVLEKLLQSQPDSLEVHLLLSEAYANTDRHAQAVALLEEAKAAYPDNAELLEKLAELNPTVTVSVPSGTYSDPQSIALSNEKGYEIRYQLNDEQEQTYDDEILLSTNGDFTLSAYAVASDGAKGESVSVNYTIKLDPEKYPLDQFVDTAEGRQYIDADGAVQTGWMTKDGKTYYFDEKGYMLTGLQTIEDSSYFFDADGVMSTGWQEQDGKYYFFDEKGQMLTDTWIDNQYYVGEDGAMLTDTTTPDGVYVNARGQKGFDAASEFANYPNSIVQAHISTKVDKGDYYEVSASVYHQKADNKPAGESYDITLKVLKHAKVHYLDNNLPDIIASDAFSFLKEIGMQKIQQDNDGYVTEFSFALGEKRS